MLSEANITGEPKKSSAFVCNMCNMCRMCRMCRIFQTGSREKKLSFAKERPDGNVEKVVDLFFS